MEFKIFPKTKLGGNLKYIKMKTNKICGIYKITSPNGYIYIGQSRDLKSRLTSYKRLCHRHKVQTRLYNSFVKHGPENHIFEVIHECKIEDLNTLEQYYIKFYDCFDTPHGMNLTSGGDFTFIMSEESRRKQSERMKKQKLSPEHLAKLIAGNKNKPYKPLSVEHKKKLSNSLKGRKMPASYSKKLSLRLKGHIVSKETREKIRNKLTGISQGNRRSYAYICQISLDGFLIGIYESQVKASIETNIPKSTINHCITKRKNKAGGYIWL